MRRFEENFRAEKILPSSRIGFAYELEARDSQANLITADFNKKVRLIFYFTREDLPPDTEPEDLQVAFYSTARGDWVALDDLFIDPEDLFATGKTEHFSRFGIMSPPARGAGEGTISPITATTPITYVWQATGVPSVTNVATSITDTAAFSWTVAGDQVVTVTASNAYGSDMTTHTVTISAYRIYLPLVIRNS